MALPGWLVVASLAGCRDDVAERAPAASNTIAPLSVEVASPGPPQLPRIEDVLAAIPEDPPPRKIIRHTHYFVSNERKPEEFRRHAEGLGGIFVGVGAEQNLLFAGWARPAALLLVDFDQWVVDVNRIHGLLFRASADPDAFVSGWSPEERQRVIALIERAFASTEERARVLDIYRIAQPGVYARISSLQRTFRVAGIPTVLTDRAEYDHVAVLFRRGHARALRGDFTGRQTLAGIARAARQLGLPVRAIYLSNVEDYFDYDSGLGDNLLAQPADARSLLLRTIPIDDKSYVYVAQRMSDFHRWMGAGVKNRANILARAAVTPGPKGLYLPGPP